MQFVVFIYIVDLDRSETHVLRGFLHIAILFWRITTLFVAVAFLVVAFGQDFVFELSRRLAFSLKLLPVYLRLDLVTLNLHL